MTGFIVFTSIWKQARYLIFGKMKIEKHTQLEAKVNELLNHTNNGVNELIGGN